MPKFKFKIKQIKRTNSSDKMAMPDLQIHLTKTKINMPICKFK